MDDKTISTHINEREKFGQGVMLAMACMEGSIAPTNTNTKAMPSDENSIRHRLKALSQDISSSHADLLELLIRFDELEGWKTSGSKHCAAWMNLELGISLQLGWEYLRVGRKLRLLPTTTALFRAGKLSWSKIRCIVNVADPENEKILCHAALDASVADVQKLCTEWRWEQDGQDKSDNERAVRQWDSRSLTWGDVSNGSTRIQLVLPPETAQAFLAGIEHSLNHLLDINSQLGVKSDCKLSQRRADAALLMAESSLQAGGRDTASADRYQVIVSVDASELALPEAVTCGNSDCNLNNSSVDSSTDSAVQSSVSSAVDSAADSSVLNSASGAVDSAADSAVLSSANGAVVSAADAVVLNSASGAVDSAKDTVKNCTNSDINEGIKISTEISTSDDSEGNSKRATKCSSAVQSISYPAKKPTLRGAGAIARETARRIACDCSITANIFSSGELLDIGRKSRLWTNSMTRAIKERDQHCQFYGCTQTRNLQIHHIVHWADGGVTSIENGVCLCQSCHTKVHEGGYSIQKIEGDSMLIEEQFAQQQRSDDLSMFTIESALRNDKQSFDRVRRLFPTRYRFRIVDAQGRDIREVLIAHSGGRVSYASPNDAEYSDSHSTRVECREPESAPYRFKLDDGVRLDESRSYHNTTQHIV